MKRLIMIYALTASTFCHAMLDKDVNHAMVDKKLHDETLPFRFGPLNVGAITQEDLRATEKIPNASGLENFYTYLQNRRTIGIALDRLNQKSTKEYKDKIFLTKSYHGAIAHQDYPAIRIALQQGADPNARISLGQVWPALFYSKSVAIASLLVAYNASFTSVDFYGNTVLHAAMNHAIPDDVLDYYLKNSGVDVNTPNNEGKRPVHELALSIICFGEPRYSNEKIALRNKAGARWDLKDNSGRTALQMMDQAILKIELQNRYKNNAKM